MPVATTEWTMTERETFGEWLRRAITASGLGTQRALAERSGIDVAAINRYVRGKVERPEYENIMRIAEALGRPVEEVAAAAGLPLVHTPDGPAPRPYQADDPRAGYTPSEIAAIVAYVEARPGEYFREQLAAERRRRTRDSYERLCVSMFTAWGANAQLAFSASATGGGDAS